VRVGAVRPGTSGSGVQGRAAAQVMTARRVPLDARFPYQFVWQQSRHHLWHSSVRHAHSHAHAHTNAHSGYGYGTGSGLTYNGGGRRDDHVRRGRRGGRRLHRRLGVVIVRSKCIVASVGRRISQWCVILEEAEQEVSLD